MTNLSPCLVWFRVRKIFGTGKVKSKLLTFFIFDS